MASRTEGFVYFLADLMAPLILIIVWQSVFSEKSIVGGYTYSEIAIYYLLVFILRTILSVYPNEISLYIRTGELNTYLTKPMGLLGTLLMGEVAWKLARLLFLTIAVIMLILFVLGPIHWTSLNFASPFLWIAIVVGFLVNYYLKASVELLGFWVGETEGIRMSFYLFEAFFAGNFLPLNMMPTLIKNISQFLPYQYFYYFPIQIIIGKSPPTQIIQNSIISAGWLIFAFFLSKFLFSRGLKRYAAYSG